jgi:hypothetical protein
LECLEVQGIGKINFKGLGQNGIPGESGRTTPSPVKKWETMPALENNIKPAKLAGFFCCKSLFLAIYRKIYFQMANIENNPEKNDKQSSDFANNQELKSKVYDAIEEQLKDSSEKAFKAEGIKTREIKDAEGQQGWNRGVYGDGSTYGTGSAKGQSTVTVNRVKGSKATNGFFEKNLSFGGKKMVVEIHVDIDVESKTMDMTYKTTEDSFFRGHHDKKGPFMIDDKLFFNLDDMSKFKKELKEKFDEYSVREANYFIKTKLGIEDRTEKSINSMVENSMKKLSLADIIKGNFDETLDKIMESTKKKEVDQNHPEVKAANTKGNLLFDDKEEDEDTVDEVTASAGGAGAGAYLTPGAWAKGGDFDKDMKKSKKPTDKIHEELQKRFEETPYAQKDKKRALKRENTEGWTTVELDSDGYAPKGMDKNHPLGLHGVEVNSSEEDRLSKGSPKGRAAMKGKQSKGLSEGLDLNKKKFVTLNENEEKGVNKRYIITHKRSNEEEKNRWASLSNFEKYSTVKLAESCGCPIEDGTKEKMVSREQGEAENERDFMKRNHSVDAGDEVNGRLVVSVPKPGSLSGAEFKVFEDDFLNESKAFILDLNSGNLVNNPNYKVPAIEEYTIEEDTTPLNESVSHKVESNIPNTAYYYNAELGRLVRNPNYKA